MLKKFNKFNKLGISEFLNYSKVKVTKTCLPTNCMLSN